MKNLAIAILLSGLFAFTADAADWPMFGSDAGRSGYTADELSATLFPQWTYHATHAPMPAWPRSDRQPFDRAFQPVIAGGTLYFGSSADGKVYALDAATGKERWSFYTGGPVRFAPAVSKERVFVASDDGFLYCLAAADGKVLWQKRGGPDGRMILGNDRMISAWPARGGAALVGDVVYFAAGVWPSDGIYLHALDAATGKLLWVNDKSGAIHMAQPHGGANANSGVSAQGYLVAAGDQLLVPTGRAVPAAFGRADGKFQYFHLQLNGQKGGTTTVAVGKHFFNGGMLFDNATGATLDPIGPGAVAAFADGVVRSTATEVIVSKWVPKEKKDRKGDVIKYVGLDKLWSAKANGGTSVIVAGKRIVAGGPKQVNVVDMATQKVAWSADVDGAPHGLAAAGGRLYVSTDQGVIHCFGTAKVENPAILRSEPKTDVYGDNALAAAAAKEIIEKTGITEGYCADLACGDGALAYELAKRTKLQICAIDADADKVALARKKLDAAGLLGVRVTVHQGDPAKCPYPKYFANLVVSGRSLMGSPVTMAEAQRLQRPFGGVLCVGKPGAMDKKVRGALAGSGNWTHQYADAANTSCSADDLVKGPLSMLWFRDSDFDMPQRHGRGPAPLFFDGRLFVEGLHGIRAVDAYNGRPLWEFSLKDILKPYNADHLMGTAGTHSNICMTADGVYVRTGSKCLRLDVATGKKLGEFEAPKLANGKAGTWGYIACEGGTLYGSLVNPEHIVKWTYLKGDMSEQFTESVLFFALDAQTGKLKWKYEAKDSIRHNALAIGGGKVYLIDRPLATMDRITADKEKDKEHPKGELLAFDGATGKVLWRGKEDIYGTLLTLGVKHDVLVMGYQPTAFRLPSERGGQMTGYRASDGKRVWDKKANYTTRPLINDRTVYATVGTQGGAWDLVSGEEKRFKLNRSYGCGQLAGSNHLMVFRSATLGYFDLQASEGTEDYGGIRPGCWINAIPAGGVVLVPDASAGCQCSYLNQAWIALQGRD
ncbi:MAG: PQQ-binding-like beta-propeller repeat protein [Gemmataceae bacterium]|nr:PQQ-binding-like beta-propeller repeat protein [Gemmataceae bacterium]